MEFTRVACTEKFQDIALAFGEPVEDMTPERASEVAVDCVRRLCLDLQISRLGELLDRDELEKVVEVMATDGYESGTPKVNPHKPTIEDMIRLYRKAL
jgi:alcohol dehydrogenase class IV